MTWHIHMKGQVQGVGFRPFVFRMAKEYGFKGSVNNTTDGVHIEVNAPADLVSNFYNDLLKKAPSLAKITQHSISKIADKTFDHFQIIHSETRAQANLLLTPDFALCADCRSELYHISNHRKNYPFITCTHCGPRFSIIHQLPYDRSNTQMDVFQMCMSCSDEYENPLDRRYYSQTNTCPNCAIKLSILNPQADEPEKDQEQLIELVIRYWQEGKIVAIKGIGGYLLTCDAGNKAAISTLRERKHRPSKPFALMYPNIESLPNVNLHKEAIQALSNQVSPIVLLDCKEASTAADFVDVAPGLQHLGIMLPYTPLYDLLLYKFGKPIVATSGNVSHSPIVFQDEKAVVGLSAIADLILSNNRKITVPQDDSVITFSPFTGQRIVLRRARGLAPTYINPDLDWPTQSIIATGAMLKSTFSFLHQGNTYISPYLGDLASFDTQENYKHTLQHFLDLFKTDADIILCDKHPAYPSTQYGENRSKALNIPLKSIQHHMAHFGAVLGENNLIHAKKPVLGVIWDGTGLGNDGQIWGGEFFKYEQYDFLRCYHFDYFDSILGDKMPKEPRISALSACWDVMGAEDFLQHKFNQTEWQVYSHLLKKENTLQTSSVGRIFDAVASLLGIMDQQTYEGEAAMQLETMALQYFKANGLNFPSSYFMEGAHYYRIPTQSLMTNILMDLQKGKAKDFIAAKFHFSLMKIIKIVANNLKIEKIAFSGGVFQNGLLVDLIQHHLKSDFQLFFHQQLSPNDENISFGQLVCYQIEQYKKPNFQNKVNEHVLSNSRENKIHRV